MPINNFLRKALKNVPSTLTPTEILKTESHLLGTFKELVTSLDGEDYRYGDSN